jgi:hypothetical protein
MQVDLDDHSVCGPGGLLERLDSLPDPRSRHGRRHPLGGLLVIAAAAVLTGARSYAAIGQFAKKIPQATRKRLGIWQRPYSGWCVAPGETTIRMLLQRLDADQLDRAVGEWLAEQADDQDPLAVDGKILKGARADGGRQVHLFAALTHDSGTIVAQRQVPAGTNETTQLAPLLEPVDLAGRIITADALHTTQAEAAWLVDHHADYVLTVKGNTPGLVTAIDHLPTGAFSPGVLDQEPRPRPG